MRTSTSRPEMASYLNSSHLEGDQVWKKEDVIKDKIRSKQLAVCNRNMRLEEFYLEQEAQRIACIAKDSLEIYLVNEGIRC